MNSSPAFFSIFFCLWIWKLFTQAQLLDHNTFTAEGFGYMTRQFSLWVNKISFYLFFQIWIFSYSQTSFKQPDKGQSKMALEDRWLFNTCQFMNNWDHTILTCKGRWLLIGGDANKSLLFIQRTWDGLVLVVIPRMKPLGYN